MFWLKIATKAEEDSAEVAYEFSCKVCAEREVGCHGWCEKYLNEKADHERRKQEKQKDDEMRHYTLNTNGTYYRGKGWKPHKG